MLHQVIARACDPTASADIAAVVMTEGSDNIVVTASKELGVSYPVTAGIANICLVTDCMTLVRQHIEQVGGTAPLCTSLTYVPLKWAPTALTIDGELQPIPRKRKAAAFGHEKVSFATQNHTVPSPAAGKCLNPNLLRRLSKASSITLCRGFCVI